MAFDKLIRKANERVRDTRYCVYGLMCAELMILINFVLLILNYNRINDVVAVICFCVCLLYHVLSIIKIKEYRKEISEDRLRILKLIFIEENYKINNYQGGN